MQGKMHNNILCRIHQADLCLKVLPRTMIGYTTILIICCMKNYGSLINSAHTWLSELSGLSNIASLINVRTIMQPSRKVVQTSHAFKSEYQQIAILCTIPNRQRLNSIFKTPLNQTQLLAPCPHSAQSIATTQHSSSNSLENLQLMALKDF